MFRPQILAIIRLYNENLSIRYTCICWGVYKVQGGKCKCEISQVWGGVEGLALGWLGTIYRQRTMSRMGYI